MEFLQEELDEILNIFLQEGSEILQSMDKNLLLLEKKPDNLEVAMHLFRDAHSLKGSARMLGFNGIQNIAHKIEDVLGLIREKKLTVTSEITDTISDALSLIDTLIKKTVEQKSEFTSKESDIHIEKLTNICKKAELPPKKEDLDEFKKNFATIEDLISGIILIYFSCANRNEFHQLQDIVDYSSKLSKILREMGEDSLQELCSNIVDSALECAQTGEFNQEALFDLNEKINKFVQEFKKVALKRGLETKDYYKKLDDDEEPHVESIESIEEELKEAELIELVTRAGDTLIYINESKDSLNEEKSLLNEIVSRLTNANLKRIYQVILTIILNFEKANKEVEITAIEAIKEIFNSTLNIIDKRLKGASEEEIQNEIEFLSQKTTIIGKMVKYDLKNPKKTERKQNYIKQFDWDKSLDSTSIKTLRVNSDKLDKLVNLIGNLIVSRIKSRENLGLVKTLHNELIELQKHYHKIGYYMKFYEKKYIQETINQNPDYLQKKDSFLGYNKQLISFNNINIEKMNYAINSINFLMKEIQENNIKLNTTTAEIENMVKAMRVLPLSTVFNFFPRMVHNIAKDKNKEIELTIIGGEVSADKKIIEDVKIPIMHIIRNSIDHGIETPKERERIGKNRTGNIILKAVQKENKIVISIKDDGRGINIQKIKQKAVEKGLVSLEAAENMSKEQLANFIFYPGFSTGDVVTELSGRGLGLDIVHSKISQLNGRIDVYSEENKGTIVALELPTSMATMKAFIIMEKNRLLAIPANSINTVLRISPDEIKQTDDKYYYIYNKEAIPIISLSSILNIQDEEKEDPDKYTIMIIKSENINIGVIVEKLIGDEEILNKKLPEPLIKVKNISGITTLASGEMCLLLNVSDILTSSRRNPQELTVTKTLTLQDNSQYKILLVDDSVTTRRLIGNILKAEGYRVDTKPGAKSALVALETNSYNLIITDYEMPLLNGVDFTKAIKKNPKTANIPVIMITSIEKEGLKEEALKEGVCDFIKKEDFEQRKFLNKISKYLEFSVYS